MAQAVLRPHLPRLQDRFYHAVISAFILTEQCWCRRKPAPYAGAAWAGTESQRISVTAAVPGALQKYFVTAHSEAQHTVFATTSLQLHSSEPLFLLQEGAAQDKGLGHWQRGRQQLSLM